MSCLLRFLQAYLEKPLRVSTGPAREPTVFTWLVPFPKPFLFHSPIFPVAAVPHCSALRPASFLSDTLICSELLCAVTPLPPILWGIRVHESWGGHYLIRPLRVLYHQNNLILQESSPRVRWASALCQCALSRIVRFLSSLSASSSR